MWKFAACVLMLFVIDLFFSCLAEIPCTQLEQLPDLKQSMLDHTFGQIEQWEKNYLSVRYEMESVLDEELIESMDDMGNTSPEVVYFLEARADENSTSQFDVRAKLFLNQTILANSMVDPLQGAFVDSLDVFGVFSNSEFRGASYLVLYEDKESPVVVTIFCALSEDQVITKTGLIYGHGQFENEFVVFTGSLLTRFGAEAFDIGFYKLSE